MSDEELYRARIIQAIELLIGAAKRHGANGTLLMTRDSNGEYWQVLVQPGTLLTLSTNTTRLFAPVPAQFSLN